ncbi:MAG: hypothetical protein IJI57_05625 [Flexilinea sp.]|nr:hypothetical protein [Flexilinea sp.]
MKKTGIIGLLLVVMLVMVLSCSAMEELDYQIIVIGQNGIYDLNSAMLALRQDAGHAVIYLNGPLNLNQQVEIPYGLKGLKSVTLASYNGVPVEVSMGGSVLCANGIPFTLEQGVSLRNGFLVGGYCIAINDTEKAEESVLVVNGSADYVIGGGLAMNQGAVSSVKRVNIVVNGSANNVHGGGYAFNGGVADVSENVNLILTRSSAVNNAAYAGGYAAGQGSSAPVAAANVIALGDVNRLNRDAGLAENGGSAVIGSYNIELINRSTAPVQAPVQNPLPVQPIPAPAATVMYIGPGQQAQNFTDAVNLLPANAGNVEFRIMGNFRQENDVVIPANRGILSLTVTGNNNIRMTVSWPEDVGFFANGIPTTIADSVYFSEGVIYGGANVGSGQQSNLQTTYLDIAGKVNKVVAGSKAKGSAASAHVGNTTLIFRGKATGWLYGGGAALYGGYSVVDGTANLVIAQGASLDLSVAGGGYAFGAGSESVVKDSVMDVSGSVIYAVFLGGYADQSSSAVTTGHAFLNLQPSGNVGQSVWYGGRAYNNSRVTVDTASAQISGRVGATVHREGRASDGGSVSIREIR